MGHISAPLYKPAKEVWSHNWARGFMISIGTCSPVTETSRSIPSVPDVVKLGSLSH